MTKKQRAQRAVDLLKEKYPLAECSLEYRHPYELLISTRLSAQCTDARVNIVTKELFGKYDSLEKLANAEYEDILAIVKPCGLGNTKAKDVIGIAKGLLERFGGQVPSTMEELTSLPGVGRKTANLILGDVFHLPAIVTDTHWHPHLRAAGSHRLHQSGGGGKAAESHRPTGRRQRFLPPAGAFRPGGLQGAAAGMRRLHFAGNLQKSPQSQARQDSRRNQQKIRNKRKQESLLPFL